MAQLGSTQVAIVRVVLCDKRSTGKSKDCVAVWARVIVLQHMVPLISGIAVEVAVALYVERICL